HTRSTRDWSSDVCSSDLFRENILSASKNNFSRIVLALDLQGSSQSQLLQTGKKLVEETSPYICAIKIGRQTVLNLGMQKTRILKIGRASCREGVESKVVK